MAASCYKPGELFRKHQLSTMLNGQSYIEETVVDVIEEDENLEHSLGDLVAANIIEDERRKAQDEEVVKTPTMTTTRKRKATNNQGKNKRPKKFSWTPEIAEDLLKYVQDYKSTCDFKGIDFEADLASMYTEVRRCMARNFAFDFGPVKISAPEKEIKDMGKEEYDKYIKQTDAQKASIKKGYLRIKEKVKALRQEYRQAVNKGSRSGSSRIVQDNFTLLEEIWGGSPATTALSFGIGGDPVDQDEEGSTIEADLSSSCPNDIDDDSITDGTSEDSTQVNGNKETIQPVCKIPKLVDNKRRHMEKRLSQAQRDQVLMTSAKEDVLMKKNMLEMFDKSNKTLEQSISKMTTSLTSLGEGIAAGMQMLAMALSQNQPVVPPHHPGHAHPYTTHPHVYHSQYSGYGAPNQQFAGSNSTINQTTSVLSSTLTGATQTLYDMDNSEGRFSNRS